MLEHFINKEHIEKGYTLLKKQIKQRSPSHLRMEYCIYWEEKKVLDDNFNLDKFYDDYVKNDEFYNLDELFYCQSYLGLKNLYGERPFQFLSFEMGVLYYAITIFIKESLESNSIKFAKSLNDVGGFTYYGGILDHKKPNKSEILYRNDYVKYLAQTENFIKLDPSIANYIISTDIKSYFYSIDHEVLLNTIKERAENIDNKIVNTLKKFLNHLMKGGKGIPVTENNIASAYLSSIYFAPFEEHLIKNVLNDPNTSYVRYVDDFYVIINNEGKETPLELREKLNNIENSINDFLYNKVKLSVSGSKSKREIKQFLGEDIEGMIKAILHSEEYEEEVNEHIEKQKIKEEENQVEENQIEEAKRKRKEEKEFEKFEKCLKIIENTKKQAKGFERINIEKTDSNYLNKIIIPKELLEFSKTSKAIEEVEKRNLFSDNLSLEFILSKHKVFLNLVAINPKLRESFHQWLLKQCSNSNSLNQKVFAIFEFYSKLLFIKKLNNDYKKKIRNSKLAVKPAVTLKNLEFNKYKSDYQIVLRKLIDANPTNLHAILVGRSLGIGN